MTHDDVEQSYFGKEKRKVLKLENIYGMIILLAVGLGGGAATLIAEIMVKWASKREKSNGVVVI